MRLLPEERPRLSKYLPLLLALALGAGFWLQRLGVNDLDDAASNEVIFARQPLATLLFDVKWPDQSPVYFVLLHFWGRLGESSRAMAFLQLVLLSLGVVRRIDTSGRASASTRPRARKAPSSRPISMPVATSHRRMSDSL